MSHRLWIGCLLVARLLMDSCSAATTDGAHAANAITSETVIAELQSSGFSGKPYIDSPPRAGEASQVVTAVSGVNVLIGLKLCAVGGSEICGVFLRAYFTDRVSADTVSLLNANSYVHVFPMQGDGQNPNGFGVVYYYPCASATDAKFIPVVLKWFGSAVYGVSSDLRRLQNSSAVSAGTPKAWSGSGIVVDDAGHVLTNNHVVESCKSLSIVGYGLRPVAATVDAVDPKNDLALLASDNGKRVGEAARFRAPSRPAMLGESIGAIGFPLPGLLSAEPKATFGQINSLAGYDNNYTLLQFSAPVQPGNSGGPLLDDSELVIGVVSSQASLRMAALAGNVPQNVNFAIRGEVAQIFLAARGIKVSTSDHQHPLSTQAIAAAAQKSTVLVRCTAE